MKITKTKSGKYTTHISINGIDGDRYYKRFTAKTKKEVMELATDYITKNKILKIISIITQSFVDNGFNPCYNISIK